MLRSIVEFKFITTKYIHGLIQPIKESSINQNNEKCKNLFYNMPFLMI